MSKATIQQQLDEVKKDLDSLWGRHGAFFAFSDKQFEEGKKEGVEYESYGSGLIAPKGSKVMEEFLVLSDKQDELILERDGIEKIIGDTLANHEYGYTWDVTQSFDELKVRYDFVTREQVVKVARSMDWSDC